MDTDKTNEIANSFIRGLEDGRRNAEEDEHKAEREEKEKKDE